MDFGSLLTTTCTQQKYLISEGVYPISHVPDPRDGVFCREVKMLLQRISRGDDGAEDKNRKNRRNIMAVVTMKQLLEAGVHFGHQTRRWNPKMKKYIYGARNGIYIIDLQKTLRQFKEAYRFVRELSADGGVILFVGTKKQAQDSIREEAERCGMPYVNQRWLGGLLTNFATIKKSVARLKKYEAMEEEGTWEGLIKKEILKIQKEKDKLGRYLDGIKEMGSLPDAVFVVDPKREEITVNEVQKLGIPVLAIVDTNCDPDMIDYVIPGNDDAIRSIRLFATKIADAVLEGQQLVGVGDVGLIEAHEEGIEAEPATVEEPGPEETVEAEPAPSDEPAPEELKETDEQQDENDVELPDDAETDIGIEEKDEEEEK